MRAGATRSPRSGPTTTRTSVRTNGEAVYAWRMAGRQSRRIDDGKYSLHKLGQKDLREETSVPTRGHGGRRQSADDQDPQNGGRQDQNEAGADDLQDAYRGCPNSDRPARWAVSSSTTGGGEMDGRGVVRSLARIQAQREQLQRVARTRKGPRERSGRWPPRTTWANP